MALIGRLFCSAAPTYSNIRAPAFFDVPQAINSTTGFVIKSGKAKTDLIYRRLPLYMQVIQLYYEVSAESTTKHNG